MDKQDVESFFTVLKYIEENQKGIWGIGNNYNVELRFLKYVGIGEGMEYESGTESDFEDLKIELLKRCEKNV